MATTITNGGTSLAPLEVLGYTSTRESRNVIHPIIGRPDPEVTMKPAGLRTGKLEMLVLTLADALALEALHAAPGVCVLTDDDLPALGMSYVTAGDIELELEDETRKLWLVRVDFQEVSP